MEDLKCTGIGRDAVDWGVRASVEETNGKRGRSIILPT